MTNEAYSTPAFDYDIDLLLNANESIVAIPDLSQFLESIDHRFINRYPDHQSVQDLIADWVGVASDRIVVTAGGDQAIERIMRTLITPQRDKVLTHAPSFEMIRIYTQNFQGRVDNVPWLDGPFPVAELMDQIDDHTAVVVVTTPNNPTGLEVTVDQIQQINQVAKQHGAKVLVDLAYVEFSDRDPTSELADDDNLMMVRTFSKAWGLAGLRIGFLVAPSVEFATRIRNAAGPYPVSALSLETARVALTDYRDQMQQNIARVVQIRGLLSELLTRCGAAPLPSGGNYVLARFSDPQTVWDGMARRGIGIRKFTGNPVLADYLRITCPATAGDYLRVAQALTEVLDCSEIDFEADALAAFGPQHVAAQPTPESEQLASIEQSSRRDRVASIKRDTKETRIELELNLDGTGNVQVATGIGFLDHMLTALAFHSGMDLSLKCVGDLHVDDHHTAEDCAIALGAAIDQALGPRKGIQRFGFAFAPLDEALARTVVDLSARPWPEIHLHLERPMIGQWACENVTHFFQSLAMTLKCSLHVDVIRGANDHHRVEAAFKSLAKALKTALTRTSGDVPSTKGVL